MSRAVIVLGSSGAGKSTLIRNLTGSEVPVIGHRMFQDGTAKVTPVPSGEFLYLDTPGLDSANFPTSITEKIQSIVREEMQVLLVLVVNKAIPRITNYIKKFENALRDLVGNERNASFLFLWRNSEVPLPVEDRRDAAARFPRATFHEIVDSNIDAVKELIANASFSPLLIHAQELPPAARANPTARANQTVPARPAAAFSNSKPDILTAARSLSTVSRFRKVISNNDLSLPIREVLKIKKNDGRLFQELKETGDAFLKLYTLRYLSCSTATGGLENRNIRERTTRVISASDNNHPMPKFFDQFVSEAHQKEFPFEELTPHGKADVVEALLEFVVNRRSDLPGIFKFIFLKLVE